ncbi:MAG: hypothetical protein AB1640_18910 [bacterium]
MKSLAQPNRQLAARVLSEVAFEDRLVGYRLRKRMGPVAVHLYSLEEVARFLSQDLPQLDWSSLREWVGDRLDDPELAAAVQEIADQDLGEHEKALRVRALLGIRLDQCRKVVST